MRCAALLLLILPIISWGAVDQNGYEAKYECRAGNTNCDVDVAALGQRACDQIISTGTSWSSINWANDTICITAGDHMSKGTLTIPNASGSPGSYKVLRYFRSGDTDDDPWNQADGDRAKLHALRVNGDFWVIHRLSFPPRSTASLNRVLIGPSEIVTDVILSRLLVEGPGLSEVCQGGVVLSPNTNIHSRRITLQNSVVRNLLRCASGSPVAVDFSAGHEHVIVNNEIYNWCEHEIQIGNNNHPTMPGIVVENNDLYKDSASYDGQGDAAGGWLLSIKAPGTPSDPLLIIHNRLSGTRAQEGDLCGTPDSGHLMGGSSGVDGDNEWAIIQNNIMFDSIGGIGYFNNVNEFHSIIGNIFFDIGPRGTETSTRVVSFFSADRMEFYLNTIIDAQRGTADGILGEWSGSNDLDIRCNVIIASDGSTSNAGSGSDADFNVFYASPLWEFGATGTDFSLGIVTRENSTSYSAGTIMRRTSSPSNCAAAGDADCFLYVAVNTGTTASTPPTFTATLGDSFQDGSITWQAMRGPHTISRKLRTGPVQLSIPYATPSADAPEVGFCPALGDSFATGARIGIGVNDEVVPEGVFATDMTGAPR